MAKRSYSVYEETKFIVRLDVPEGTPNDKIREMVSDRFWDGDFEESGPLGAIEDIEDEDGNSICEWKQEDVYAAVSVTDPCSNICFCRIYRSREDAVEALYSEYVAGYESAVVNYAEYDSFNPPYEENFGRMKTKGEFSDTMQKDGEVELPWSCVEDGNEYRMYYSITQTKLR